jgi:protein-disulfide isomerase
MGQNPTRSEQRDAARAKAREIREAHKKSEQRRKYGLFAGVVGAVLVLGGLIGWAVVANAPAPAQIPTNMIFDGGIKIGKDLKAFTPGFQPTTEDVPKIQIFVDYQCPFCQAFELPNAALIESKVAAGDWVIEYHPFSFLDGAGSPNAYSSRAANAAVCVAEYSPDSFMKFNNVLFANQPAESTPGPENDGLIALAQQVGVKNFEKIQTCVNEKSFGDWILQTTSKQLNAEWQDTGLTVDSTPYIIVNGQRYTGTTEEMASPARFEQWVTSASNG